MDFQLHFHSHSQELDKIMTLDTSLAIRIISTPLKVLENYHAGQFIYKYTMFLIIFDLVVNFQGFKIVSNISCTKLII